MPDRPPYTPSAIEPRIQDLWENEQLFVTDMHSKKEKFYILDMFPYPSGQGLHVGHPRGYLATDAIARIKKMQGFEVLHPMGWDAFGLPAENYAIKTGTPPQESVPANAANYRRQLQMLGMSYDWTREINTSDPAYYRWTQWIFRLLFERGLAYKAEGQQWWCPMDKTVLANEQVKDGRCDRCGATVTKKTLSQWFFKITDYADRLLADLEGLDWPERIKAMQRNWIGRSEGAEIRFAVEGSDVEITVFTTRPDTLYGATFLVVAPESPLVEGLATAKQQKAVAAYRAQAMQLSEIDRQMTDRPKTGVFTGSSVFHPLTGVTLPVWVADYVLAGYGTGAIMAVPAHDARDRAFAEKFDLPIVTVIEPVLGTPQENPEYRRSIAALVENPKTGEILTNDWGPALGGRLLIGGGIDEGESPEQAARREIREETGYSDLELVEESELIHFHYFAHSKNVARYIDATGLHFRLKSDARDEVQLEVNEQGKFRTEWVARDEALRITDPLHRYVLQRFIEREPYVGEGILTNSGPIDGKSTDAGAEAIIEALAAQGRGARKVQYKLRDWLISRQRYWGAPIPIIHCASCGPVAVPAEELPVLLPFLADFSPSGEGRGPLAKVRDWVETTCPTCGGPGERETDTMDGFACSSWYFLRYLDPTNDTAPFDPAIAARWMPVDLYVGGAEHAVMHLLYARFWTKVLHDAGLIPFVEPFARLMNQGMILGPNGAKMSKSKGNVINPDDVIARHGTDALRVYEYFIGPFEQEIAWSDRAVSGVARFLRRVYDLAGKPRVATDPAREARRHRLITRVQNDIDRFQFNTIIAALMEASNTMAAEDDVYLPEYETFVQLLAPFGSHLAEHLWRGELGHTGSIFLAGWPVADPALARTDTVEIAVQVNGKVRASFSASRDLDDAALIAAAKEDPNVTAHLDGKTVVKTVVVPNRIVNFVVQ